MKKKLFLSTALVVSVFALASCIQPTPAPPWVPAGCVNSTHEGAPAFYFNGVENQVNNAHAFILEGETELNTEGCEGDPAEQGTIVRAPNAAAAVSVCDSLGFPGLINPANLSANGYQIPANAWTCLEQP